MNVFRTREPDFNRLIQVLKRKKTETPVLFEIFMNQHYHEFFSGKSMEGHEWNSLETLQIVVDAYYNAGYDYTTTHASEFRFPVAKHNSKSSISLNEKSLIQDRESFEAYPWMNPEDCDYSKLEAIKDYLPADMKLLVMGPNGVLENVTAIIGYDNLCYMLYEDMELVEDVFNKVGSSMLRYYEIALEYEAVGGIISNDDWGFNTQTFLSTEHLRKLVFPWHKKIVEAAHKRGKYAILHSCGNMNEVFDDIIDNMQFDAKHSFEDNICTVEESIRRWGDRIAILGGLDINYLISAPLEDVKARAKKLADIGVTKGGYALGTGNSMCDYIPEEKAIALINTAVNYKNL